MKKNNCFLRCIIILMIFCLIVLPAMAKTEIGQLICEYKINPLGIDVLKPRLSWQLVSSRNDVMQSAYEIRVADFPGKLNSDKLIWSTGKVNTTQSVNVVYNGPALSSMQRVYWQVRVWDSKNKATAWSKPASWEMGILNPSEWKAFWISFGQEKEAIGSKPVQHFRKEFSVSKKVKSARVYATALGLYQLQINGKKCRPSFLHPDGPATKKGCSIKPMM
jgi:alpha-L-rhamnosidase